MDLGGAKRSRSPSAASPAAFWVISLVPPGEAQRSGFAGKRRSKGTSAVFATRRKRSRVDFATTSRHGQSNSPPAGGEIPLRKEPSSGPMRASGPTKKRSIIAPSSAPFGGTFPPRGRLWGEIASSSVTASPCHLPPRGRRLRGAPSSIWPDGQPSFQKGKAFEGEGPSFVPGRRLEKCGGKLPCEKTDKELMLCRQKPSKSTPNSSSSRTF